MKLTPEMLEKLIDGLSKQDITKNTSVSLDTEEEQQGQGIVAPLEKQVLGYMKHNLPDLGINRDMGNFSADHPVNLLMNADARYIAGEAAKILDDEGKTDAAIDQYLELFAPMFEVAADAYCESKGKTPQSLTEDDFLCIIDWMVQVSNEELASALMQGQQFSAIYEIAHEMQAHEDFDAGKAYLNPDAINFRNQWTHCKTAVGEMLSLDTENASEQYVEDDTVIRIVCKTFLETLDETDAAIFRMRQDGYTHAEIAQKLGYKTSSAVTKRIDKLRVRWDEFTDEHEQRYRV